MREKLAATRMNRMRVRRRSEHAEDALTLLRDKREALLRAFLGHVSERVRFHDRLIDRCREAVGPYISALAGDGKAGISSYGWAARRDLALEVERETVWGVAVATFRSGPLRRGWRNRNFDPAGAGWAVSHAADGFEEILDLILDTAATEIRIKRLGAEIRKTSRRINALEGRLIPALATAERRIGDQLEEAERDEGQRLRRMRLSRRAA